MPSKTKKVVVEEEGVDTSDTTEDENKEEVIEVKTSKKKTPTKEKPTGAETVGISSFAQLDADKPIGESEDKKDSEEVDEEASEEEEKDESKEEVEEAEEKPGDSSVSTEEAKKWLKGVSPEIETEGAGEKGSKLKILFIILAVAVILGIIAGGFYYYRSRVSKKVEAPTPSPTPVSATPTPTPSEVMEELDLSEYSVSLLNGSGVPGEAGNAEELLSRLEFADIKTGNAESYDYEQTEVSLKKNLSQGVYGKIEAALSETYNVSLSETTLDEDSTFDVIIIVGKKK